MSLRVPDKKEGEDKPHSPRKEKKEKKDKKKKKTPRNREEQPSLLDLPIEETSGPINKSSTTIKSCPVHSVTVYNDRAEVTRVLTATVKAGTNEVSILGLSSRVDSNSVRVSGGHGNAVILEVSYNQRWEPKNKDDGSEAGRLRKELEELDDKISNDTETLGRIKKENDWVEEWGQTLSAQRKDKAAGTFFSAEIMEQAINFLDFYQKKLADIDERRTAVEKSLKELRAQRERVDKSLQAISSGATEQVHEVLLLLYAPADADVELLLSYVVMGAAWHAAYDVRVQSDKDQLDLTYYGIITNNSQDDWNDAPLSLSTAQPSVGGAPPELNTKFVGFRQVYASYGHGSHWGGYRQQMVDAVENVSPWLYDAGGEIKEEDDDEGGNMQVMTSTVQESSICTSFTIPRKTTILSDSKPHKVTIRLIQLKAKFTYVMIPKQSTHAYLKASIRNTSDNYPFLPGEMNVFMDGNFVTKSNIKAVSPQESFAIFLGIDDSIKITYPPGVFFKDTQGFMRKSNLKTTKHTITVKNTKSKDITVVIFDQLPKSNDSSIKVKLIKPVIQEGDKSSDVTLTEANNLKWKKTIEAGGKLVLPFEYSIEWPVGQELTM